MNQDEFFDLYRNALNRSGTTVDQAGLDDARNFWQQSADAGLYSGAGYGQGADAQLASAIARQRQRFAQNVGRTVDSQSVEGNALYGSGSGNPTNTPGGPMNQALAAPSASQPVAQPATPAVTPAVTDWFSQHSFEVPDEVPAYTMLERPDDLNRSYTPPVWNETYRAPTYQDLLQDPGYQASEAAMQRGLERSAASRGTILSGGFAGQALPRALGEFASQGYENLGNRTFQQYLQRYGQFGDAANRDYAARGLNEGTYQQNVANNLDQYNTRYRARQDAIRNNLDLAQLSLNATTAGRP